MPDVDKTLAEISHDLSLPVFFMTSALVKFTSLTSSFKSLFCTVIGVALFLFLSCSLALEFFGSAPQIYSF